ncbi:MAG: TonB family protein [Sphingomonas sp.]|nr:TonB family protein [Sphingomonas sp.]
MASYTGTAGNDRAKALAGVLMVHAVLGAIILTGLNVHNVRQVVESLKTFDIKEVPPPPPVPPPPQPRAEKAKEEEGAAGKKAEPSPIVVPKPKIVVPAKPPVAAAPVAGVGSASTAGAALSGTGTGAGGSGTGRGGGGSGDYSGFTPAQRISKIPDSQYRRIMAVSGQRSGRIGITLKVNTDGRPSNCRVARSSGNPTVDSLFCELAVDYVRFRPARDAGGRPVAQDITWYPDWSPRF